jgi:hypothetical protein
MNKKWQNTIGKWLSGMQTKVKFEVDLCSNRTRSGMGCGFLYPFLELARGMQKMLPSVNN